MTASAVPIFKRCRRLRPLCLICPKMLAVSVFLSRGLLSGILRLESLGSNADHESYPSWRREMHCIVYTHRPGVSFAPLFVDVIHGVAASLPHASRDFLIPRLLQLGNKNSSGDEIANVNVGNDRVGISLRSFAS